MITISASARRRAETTLTAPGVITRPVVATFDPTTGTVTPGTPTPVWSGRCSVSPPTSNDRTHTIGDDRIIGSLVCRVPADACNVDPACPATTTGDPDDIEVGDTLTIGDDTYTVRVAGRRTTEVLRRLTVVDVSDAEQVPK